MSQSLPLKKSGFQRIAMSILAFFLFLLAGSTGLAYTRQSGFTGMDMNYYQQLRQQKIVDADDHLVQIP